MGSTEAPIEKLQALTPEAAAMLEQLVVQSKWNQTQQDWGVFFRHGSIAVVRDNRGTIVASGAVLPMNAGTAPNGVPQGASACWISMILVDPAHRGRGLGMRVFDHNLRQVEAAGMIAMLDATPQGESLYRHFGFEPVWRLTRWRREARAAGSVLARAPHPATETLAALDTRALGFSRGGLLAELTGRADSQFWQCSGGFALRRAGRVAQHIGPLLATSCEVARELLHQALKGVETPVLVDSPNAQNDFSKALREADFAPERGFARMALAAGRRPVPQGEPALIHAIAGPEFA